MGLNIYQTRLMRLEYRTRLDSGRPYYMQFDSIEESLLNHEVFLKCLSLLLRENKVTEYK